MIKLFNFEMDFIEYITHQSDHKIIDFINEKINTLKPSSIKETSTLYNKITKNTESNQKIRKSFKFNVFDQELFAYVKVILSNMRVTEYECQIIFDELELLVYEPGGFFLPHTDFEKLKSNTFQMYTMLIGLNSDVVGGETVLCCTSDLKSENEQSQSTELKVFNESITKGGVLIFRNDLEHASNVVMTGIKNVLKVNLILHRKIKDTTIDGLLIITNDNHANIIPYDMFIKQTQSLLYEAYHNKKKVLKLDISSQEYDIMIKVLSCNDNSLYELFMTNIFMTQKLQLKYIDTSLTQINKYDPHRVLIKNLNEFLNSDTECFIFPEHLMNYYNYACDLKINNLVPIQLIYYSIDANGESCTHIDNRIGHFSIYDGLPLYSYLCARPHEGWTNLHGYYAKSKLKNYDPLYTYDFNKLSDYKSARNEHYKLITIYDDDQYQSNNCVAIEGSSSIDYLTNVVFLMRDQIVNDLTEQEMIVDDINEDNFPKYFDKDVIMNGYDYIKRKFTSIDYFHAYFIPYTSGIKKEIDTEHVEDSYWCNASGYYSVTLNSFVGFLKMKQ